jgi:hypothetical protein
MRNTLSPFQMTRWIEALPRGERGQLQNSDAGQNSNEKINSYGKIALQHTSTKQGKSRTDADTFCAKTEE